MRRVRLFYGSTTGNTERVANLIRKELGEARVVITPVNTASAADLEAGKDDLLIFGVSSWGAGDLQEDWESFLPQLDSVDLTGRIVALFGLGDQVGYPDTFNDAMGILHDKLCGRGLTVVGKWPADGYSFNQSAALANGSFVGLALDEDNEAEKTPQRISQWISGLDADLAHTVSTPNGTGLRASKPEEKPGPRARWVRWPLAVSRWLHKWVGLLLAPFFLWMGVSGILLNHKSLVDPFSVPLWLLGGEHRYRNWSRGAGRGVTFSVVDPERAYFYGKEGIWVTSDRGESFAPLNNGVPAGAGRDITALLAVTSGGADELLLAGGKGGLLARGESDDAWRAVELPAADGEIRQILQVRDRLLVFSDSGAFAATVPAAGQIPVFQRISLLRPREDGARLIGGVPFTFALHSGEILGLPGRLVMDAAALILIFLAVSGFFTWYIQWRYWLCKRWGWARPKRRSQALGWFSRNHNKVGIWSAPVLALVCVTGVLMTIPIVMILRSVSVSDAWAPGLRSDNPWRHRIESALFDARRNVIVIAADGYWEAPSDLSQPFRLVQNGPEASLMGVNAFQQNSKGDYIVGSFGGLFRWDRSGDHVTEVGAPMRTPSPGSPVRGFMTTGFFEDPAGRQWGISFSSGLKCFDGDSDDYRMPGVVADEGRIPMWLVMHYLHNNRIWSMFSRPTRILLALLGGCFALGVVITGIVDWLALHRRGHRGATMTRQLQSAGGEEVRR